MDVIVIFAFKIAVLLSFDTMRLSEALAHSW